MPCRRVAAALIGALLLCAAAADATPQITALDLDGRMVDPLTPPGRMTATVLVLRPGCYVIAQVGDTRAYRLRNGLLSQLTKDHSYIQELVDAGVMTSSRARNHPYKNVISRCVGTGDNVIPDIYRGSLEPGDTFLVTSDGLTGVLEDEDLVGILSTNGGPRHWVDRMIGEAKRRGGLDDITAIVVRIEAV